MHITEQYGYQDSVDKPLSSEDRHWLMLMAFTSQTGELLSSLKQLATLQGLYAKEIREPAFRSQLTKLTHRIERTGTDFANALRELLYFYQRQNKTDMPVINAMGELLKLALTVPLTEGHGRLDELQDYLENFAQGQYRSIDPELFVAFETMPDEPGQAVSALIDKHAPRINKTDRKALALAVEQLIHTRVQAGLLPQAS